ncbi:hypothetical protein SCH4B_2041 [Ruegeria sp. TrichCH4B]|nr:hypothetical protein SCH4B_2041 [Ruegeria sp. TrichCH4B]
MKGGGGLGSLTRGKSVVSDVIRALWSNAWVCGEIRDLVATCQSDEGKCKTATKKEATLVASF